MNIKIGGTTFSIKHVPDLQSPEDNSSLNGRITWADCLIQIREGLSKQKVNQVLVHEAMHGILNDYCIEDENEGVVVKIGNGVYSFIVNNADFIKELIKHDQKLNKTKD